MFDFNSYRNEQWDLLKQCLVDECFTEAQKQLVTLYSIERFWSFPGGEVLAKIQHYISNKQPQLASSLVINVISKLNCYTSRKFRPYGSNLDYLDRLKYTTRESSHVKSDGEKKPRFDLLIFHPDPYNYYSLYYNSLLNLQSERDDFYFDIIMCSNLADAIAALAVNSNIQSVVSMSGCLKDSDLDFANRYYLEIVKRYLYNGYEHNKDNALILRDISKIIRPEIDSYYISQVEFSELPACYHTSFDKMFFHINPFKALAYYVQNGIRQRYSTPFYNSLRSYGKIQKTVFHALPVAQGGSVQNSVWTEDFYNFYGKNTFSTETSGTQRGLDSLLNPKGAIKIAQDKAAEVFGSDQTYFVTNGSSTSNKIVMQANLAPNDIVLVSSDCHKSIPYGCVLSGASVIFLQTYPVPELDLYGAIPLDLILDKMQQLKKVGELHRLKAIVLTNCTFDGLTYDVEHYMKKILYLKPDIVFHWDEAWFAHAHFHPLYYTRHAVSVARQLQEKLRSIEYQQYYEKYKDDKKLLDPSLVKIRVYATQSTHKTLSSFRQGSMIHIIDEQFNHDQFIDAFYTHTSTSPSYQILSSLDVARRQVSLEGFSLVENSIRLALKLRTLINEHPKVSSVFSIVHSRHLSNTTASESSDPVPFLFNLYNQVIKFKEYGHRIDPTRLTLDISKTGLTGGQFRKLLINRFNIQVNKTSKKTVLFIINIAATEQSIDYLFHTLCEVVDHLATKPLVKDSDSSIDLLMPQVRSFHRNYIQYQKLPDAVDIRKAYYDAYDQERIDYIPIDESTIEKAKVGEKWVSASFVTPYPPGFPLLVPGQIIDLPMLEYLADIINDEIHGLSKENGAKVFKQSFLKG